MRDLQHWKDKVELSLDGRQVFFLFFGGAVLACLLFAVGVMTGRRLEARAIALESPSAEDPLAALDQLGDLEDEELSYHRTLTHDGKAPGPTHVREDAEAHGKPVAAKPSAAPAAKPVPIVAPHAPAAKPPVPIGKPASAALDEAIDSSAEEPAVAVAQLPKPPVAAAKPAVVVAKPAVVVAKPVVAAAKPSAPIAGAQKGDGKEVAGDAAATHFTLQLSAFAARRDADDFMHRVQLAGYKAFVVSSDLPGKGVMYRVRVGDFASKDAALAEKGAVEKKLRVSAYLAKL